MLLTTIEAAVAASLGHLNLAEKQIEVTEKKSKAEQELLEDPTVESVILTRSIHTPMLIGLIRRTTTSCQIIEQKYSHC